MPHSVFGIELTSNYIYAGIVSEDGDILAQTNTSINQSKAAKPPQELLIPMMEDLLSKAKLKRKDISGIGLSTSTPLTYSKLSKALSQTFGVPAQITHTGNAAALAEIAYGMATHWQNFITISLDSDLQCGIVLSGELAMGAHQMAGGLGHTLVHLGGDKHERLMEHLSESGIKRAAWKLMADMPETDSVLKNYNYRELQARHVVDAALNKDTLALKVFAQLGAVLGLKLSDVVHHFSPEAFVFSSSMPEVPSLLLATTKEYLEKNTLAVFRGKALLATSSLENADAPILRGAAIAWQHLAIDSNPA